MSKSKARKENSKEKSADRGRRDFIKKAGAAAGGVMLTAGCETVKPGTIAGAAAARRIGPNDKIQVALVGVGGRGSSLLRQVLGMKDQCEVVAVCDLYQRRLTRAKDRCAQAGNRDVKTFTYHPDLLDLPEVDAVIIATPDHWHATVALAAMANGKDVYCEKPMTHTIDEARRMAETEARLGRIVQVGSQTTSADQWWNAKKAISDGMIGRLLMSQGSYHRNSEGGEWNYGIDQNAGPDKTGEDHVEWDWWQQPAENHRPWSDQGAPRFFRFRKYWDYSGGIATDLFFHVMAPLNLCWPETEFPYRVVGMGGIYEFDDGREVPDTFMLSADYPSGHSVVLTSSMANSTHIPGLIRGHEGTITMVEHGQFEGRTPYITVRPEERIKEAAASFVEKWGSKEVKIPTRRRPSHMQNFFDCVRSREETVLSARKAYRVQVAITLSVWSYRAGKVLYFDPRKEKATDRPPTAIAKLPTTPGWLNPEAIA